MPRRIICGTTKIPTWKASFTDNVLLTGQRHPADDFKIDG
jgi:hypothetical protein